MILKTTAFDQCTRKLQNIDYNNTNNINAQLCTQYINDKYTTIMYYFMLYSISTLYGYTSYVSGVYKIIKQNK